MNNIGEFLGPVAVLAVFAIVVKMFLDHQIRKKLIDKGAVDENVKFLFDTGPKSKELSAVKWGLLSIAMGIALFVGTFMSDRYYGDQTTVGLMFLLGGMALIAYYIFAGIIEKRDRNE